MLNQVLPPPGEARPDWNILEELATALGRPMGYFSARDIFREMALTIPFYRGLRLRDLEGDGMIVVPFGAHGAVLRGGRPYAFAPVRTVEAPVSQDAAAYPFEMIAGRSLYHFGSMSTRSKNLQQLCPEGFVEISQEDAAELGVNEGDRVEVRSPSGSFVAPVKPSGNVDRGMVFVPTNFPSLGVYSLFQENTTVCRVNLTSARNPAG
jgi:predicted molibdopterin-dependent oxidoreductase YjgC